MGPLHPINLSARDVGYWCNRIAHALRGQLNARLEPLALNFSEALILLELDRQGPRSIGELSRESGHTHPSILKQVDSLVRAGLVACSAKPDDRRVRKVELTPAALPLLVEIREIIAAVNDEAVAGLTPPMRENLLAYLYLIYGNVTIAHNHAQEHHPALVVGIPSSPRTSK